MPNCRLSRVILGCEGVTTFNDQYLSKKLILPLVLVIAELTAEGKAMVMAF